MKAITKEFLVEQGFSKVNSDPNEDRLDFGDLIYKLWRDCSIRSVNGPLGVIKIFLVDADYSMNIGVIEMKGVKTEDQLIKLKHLLGIQL